MTIYDVTINDFLLTSHTRRCTVASTVVTFFVILINNHRYDYAEILCEAIQLPVSVIEGAESNARPASEFSKPKQVVRDCDVKTFATAKTFMLL